MTRRTLKRGKMRDNDGDRLSTPTLVGIGLAWLVISAGILFFVLPIIAQQTKDEMALKARGVASTGQALRVWTAPGGRAGPSHHLTFSFVPAGATSAVVDDVHVTAREARALRVPSTVPIVYLADDPGVALLNMDDAVHRHHPKLVGIAATAFMLLLLVGMWGALAVFTADAVRERRQRRR